MAVESNRPRSWGCSARATGTVGFLAALLTGFCTAATAADITPDGQSLQNAASDPTASVMAFQVQNFYSPNFYNSAGSADIVQLRAAIPFQAFGLNHIARVTVPYAAQTASGASGLGDITCLI